MAKRRIAIFEDLKQALEDARDFEQGRRIPLRVTEVPPPPKRPPPTSQGVEEPPDDHPGEDIPD